MKLRSLSIFFPFYNDAGTVKQLIAEAYTIGQQVADELEVIAIHGGLSRDETWREIMLAKQKHPKLRVINQAKNQVGYAVIKHGFKAAKFDWVFYTDGDAQYYLKDLKKLIKAQAQTGADVVNGFKTKRHDAEYRLWLGDTFENLYQLLVRAPIRDIHCDFRLVRRQYVKKISWTNKGSSVISELILKTAAQGATFAQVPVTHRERVYGISNYAWLKLTLESCQELLWSLQYKYLSRHRL